MMRTWVARLAFLLAGGVAQAQTANESTPGLESCFEAARVADATCSKLAPEQRVHCFAKARTIQLECLDRILSDLPAGSKQAERPSDTVQSAPPANGAPADEHAERNAPKVAAPVDAVGSVPADQGLERPDPEPKSPEPKSTSGPTPTATLSSTTEEPGGAARPAMSTDGDDKPVRHPDWVLSETTSPVDYSPLLTAVLHSISSAKDAPSSFTVRCRAQRTEVSLRTNGSWDTSRRGAFPVESQVDELAVVRQQWSLSTDGRMAIYKDDAVAFLQSLPEGATLKVVVTPRENVRSEATFRLVGLSAIRQKVAAACKWAPVTATSDRR
jgi:hypothetical protein